MAVLNPRIVFCCFDKMTKGTFIVAVICFVVLGFISTAYMYGPHYFIESITGPCKEGVNFKRYLSESLEDIAQDLRKYRVSKEPVSPFELRLKLDGLISILDPDYAHEKHQERKQMETMNLEDEQGKVAVCPEKYMGSKYGYPFHLTNFKILPCNNSRPLKHSVTIVIAESNYENVDVFLKYLPYVLNDTSDLNVIVISETKQIVDIVSKYSNARVIKSLDTVTTMVETPYTLLARDLTNFHYFASLERQIRVMETLPDVSVVSGSSRNLTGHWRVGCYQLKVHNSILIYTEGYEHSVYECMLCDHVDGSVLVPTELLNRFPFDKNVPADISYEEWCFRLSAAHKTILSCPDIMYFSIHNFNERRTAKETWLPLVKKHSLYQVYFPEHDMKKYSCHESKIDCSSEPKRGHLYAPCCLDSVINMLTMIDTICSSNDLQYEIGSELRISAVMYNDIAPLDEIEVLVLPEHFEKLVKEISLPYDFNSQHSYVKDNLGNKIVIRATMFPKSNTKIKIRNAWFKCADNPVGSSGRKNIFVQSATNNCTQPLHSCLLYYPPNGNKAFKTPYVIQEMN